MVGGPAEGDVFERKKRFWVSDNAPLSRNIVAVPRQGLVCSILQCLQSVAGHQPPLLQTSPLQHCTQTLHGAMPGWSHGHVSPSQPFQTDVMRPMSTSCRHSHDFMQTEHYTGTNYGYKNNQVRRIIYNFDPSSSDVHSLKSITGKCYESDSAPVTPPMSCAPGV